MIGTIRTILALLFIGVITGPLALGQAIAIPLGLNQKVMPRLWHRAVVRVLGFRVHVTGKMSDKRPLLIAANHISWTDIMVMGSVADVHFVAKAEVKGWPVFGTMARLARCVFIDRERPTESRQQATEIAERMDAGDPMLFFAEGSTADGNFLLPFKSTLFGAAHMVTARGGFDAAYVQPVAIAYTGFHGMPMGRIHRGHAAWIGDRTLVPHIKQLLAEGGVDVEVFFGEPVEFRAGGDRKRVTREVEARVNEMFIPAIRGETRAG